MTPETGPKVGAVLADAVLRLRAAGVPDPPFAAAAVMALALRTDRGGVAVRLPDPLGPEAAARFAELLDLRVLRKPLQHLSGRTVFRGLDFEVNADVLIPRPETEGLVTAVLGAGIPDVARIADLGTGSGCIAVSLAAAQPLWWLAAVDISERAIHVAGRNAAKHGVTERVRFIVRDFAVVPASELGTYDAVVSNPPYVSASEWDGLDPEVRDHEPRLALVPGPTGNEAYETIVLSAGEMLAKGGLLALELGWKSEAAVRELVAHAGFTHVEVRPDMMGIPRVLTARR